MQRLGCILVAWLLLSAVSFAQDDTEYLAERDWQIPITVKESLRTEVQSLSLYVSSDLGKTWKKEATAKPTDEFFRFVAQQDGVYWFTVRYVNKAGQTVPARESDLQPQQKIIVDTKRPEVKVQALERMNDQVTVSWDVKDEYLDLNSLTLQYRATGENAWKAVALTPVANGRKQFSSGSNTAVSVRVTAKDKAGNLGEGQVEVLATTMVTSDKQTGGAPSPNNSTPMLPPPVAPVLSASGPSNASLGANSGFQPPKGDSSLPPAFPTNNTPPSFGNAPMSRLPETGFKPAPPVANTGTNGHGGYAGFQRGQVGPVLWSNSLHLDLDFDVKAGPSGVGVLELYYTLDAGKTWQLLDKREESSKPFSVDVPNEGIYGFTMVVKNKAGLGRQAPQPGELPEVRVGVDITAPVCEIITPLEPVPGSKGLINVKWTAIDANLASGPVKIEWSENPSGPWHLVVDKQPNNGVFRWRVPEQTPYQVFLKMEVTDVAGNIGQFITREPVLVDLQMPEVKIIGLSKPKKP